METVLLAIHIILVVALVLVILIQRTSSDGLSGLGGGSSGGGAIFSARGSANFFTRATAFLATGFICTSLALAYIASHREGSSIADKIAAEDKNRPAVVKPAEPEVPAAPSVPLAN